CAMSCHPPIQTSFLPTRLIDLGTDAASIPRLIETADEIKLGALNPSEPIQYAALSYCWGNPTDASAQTKTEPSNLHERRRAIPTDSMSTVIQDSVTVCRAFSVRYLWIDALCIIQNGTDQSDWERESKRVGMVYQHAYFTICALSVANCHQSFLDRSQHTFAFDFQSSLYPPARGKYTLHYAAGSSEAHYPLDVDRINSSWSTRGWIFREDRLSTRKILFGQQMVHFECGRFQIPETGEHILSLRGGEWPVAGLGKLERDQVYRHFHEVLGSYANLGLSRESDQLPALAGLAKVMFDITQDQYLAGLWKEDLHRGLLWNKFTRNKSLAERLDSLRAPSWSWVSQPGHMEYGLCGPTFWGDRHLRPAYSDIDAWTVLQGAQLNQFGEVKSGTIRLRGKVIPVPGDFVMIRQHLFTVAIWKVYHHSRVVAHCRLDWNSVSPTLERGRLKLLLLSSSCSAENPFPAFCTDDWRGDEHDEQEHRGETNPGSSSHVKVDSSGTALGWHVGRVLVRGSGADPPEACVLCSNQEHNRNAWGLIIHPAKNTGEYYRVGLFSSRAGEVGGIQFFKDIPDQRIDIV
ncbi:heterokaryon incompatibility protein-domain-containing protein, partial [Staphylotrichum tortipilum]